MPTSVGDLNYISVHGRYEDYTGSPMAGTITFTPSVTLQDPGSDLLLVPKNFSVALDGTGFFTIDLPATNDPDITPVGWTYQVTENFLKGRTFSITVPYDAPGASISLAALAPADTSVGAVNYVLLPTFNTAINKVKASALALAVVFGS